MKKEELQIKIGRLEKELEDEKEDDLRIRKQLSELLGAGIKVNYNSFNKEGEQIVYSWMDIAFEIGKLKSLKDFRNFEDRTSDMDNSLQDLNIRFKKIEDKLND